MLFQAKGVDRHSGPAASGTAAQDAVAAGIVSILFLVGAANKPLGQVIQQVVAEGGAGVDRFSQGTWATGKIPEAEVETIEGGIDKKRAERSFA